MTTAEAAAALGVTQRRVGQLVAEGKLPALKLHGHFMVILRADVEDFAARPRQQGWPRGKARKSRGGTTQTPVTRN